jgi:glycosyltransferase 2 family protein
MTAPEAGPARSRARWTGALRLAVSGGLLALLVSKIQFGDLVPERRSLPGTLTFLLVGIGLMALSIVVASWRWQKVLAVFDAVVPLRRLISIYFAGQFVGNVLPSTIGGDVLRITRVSKDVGARDTAFASVLVERLTGFVSLPLVMLIGFLIQPSLATTTNGWIAVIAGVGTVVVFGLILIIAGHPNLAGRFTEHENWMRYIGVVHIGVNHLRRHPRDAVGVIATACLYQTIVAGGVYCAVHTIGLTIPNAAVLAFVPAVAIAQVLPISVGGFGLREGLLVLLLHPLGVETGQAVAVGLLWYAMVLIASLAGAPAFAIGHRAHPVPAGGKA